MLYNINLRGHRGQNSHWGWWPPAPLGTAPAKRAGERVPLNRPLIQDFLDLT